MNLARELALEVAPYKAQSLHDWLATQSVTASIADIGTVTVSMLGNRPDLGFVMALVRRWMRAESVEALFAACVGIEFDVAVGDLGRFVDDPGRAPERGGIDDASE